MTQSELFPVYHIQLPGVEIAREIPRAKETINAFLRRTGWDTRSVPTVCMVDGEYVLRKDWRNRRFRKGSVVQFHSMPSGGSVSGSSIAGLLGTIALTALAPWAGAAIFGAGTLGAAFFTAGTILAGSFLLSTLSRVQQGGSQEGPTPVYSWNRQINSARPLQPFPAGYGRTQRMLDYAALPWYSFEGDKQFVHLVLSEGEGRWSREQILTADTSLWTSGGGVNPSFTGVEINFYDPNEEITAFPINVESSTEVDGQELSTSYVGGFAANSPGTTATKIYADIQAPQGVYATNAKGKQVNTTIIVHLEARSISDTGTPLGGWGNVATYGKVMSSKSPVRFSLTADLPPGRYEARVRREPSPVSDATIVDTLNWVGLRSLITGPTSFPGSVITIRAPATDQFSGAALDRISVIETRILPVWNGTEWVEEPTRSPAWAAFDIATNTLYGGRHPITAVDFQSFVDFDAIAGARGDTFDYEFTSTQPNLEAIDIALAVSRGKSRWLAGTLSIVRDEPVTLPEMVITDNEIIRGSLQIDYSFKSSESAQCVVHEYRDETTWQPAEAIAPRDASEEARADATRLQLPGVVNRRQAQREAEFLLRQNLYRRQKVKLETERDGRMLSVGSTVFVQSNLPQDWGQSGKVNDLAVVGSSKSLIVNIPLTWGATQNYVLLRDKKGKPFGPIKCSMGSSPSIVALSPTDLAAVEAAQGTTIETVLARTRGSLQPSFSLGEGSTWMKRCVVLRGTPRGDRVSLELFVDDARVHDDNLTIPPPLPDGSELVPKTLYVAGLTASFIPDEFPPKLRADWFPTPGAILYTSRVSYDEGASWQPVPGVKDPKLLIPISPVALWLDVAALDGRGRQGPWSRVELDTPVIRADNVQWDINNFNAGLKDLVGTRISELTDTVRDYTNQLAMLLAEQDAANYLEIKTINRELKLTSGRLTAAYTELIEVKTGPDSALAQAIQQVIASVDDLSASVDTRITAAVGPGSAIASQISALTASVDTLTGEVNASLDVKYVAATSIGGSIASYEVQAKVSDGVFSNQAGLRILVFGSPGAYRSEVWVEADRFAIGKVGTAGYIAPFIVSGGSIYIRGDMYIDGSITASKLSVASLQAISGNMGTLTAGRILSPDGRIDFNLNAGYLYFSGS